MTERRALTGAEIRVLLDEIGKRLDDADRTATALVVGGAAVALTLGTRDSTTDVDAIDRGAPEVYAIADEVGAEHGLLEGWFNRAAAAWVPPLAFEWSREHFVTGGLTIYLADARTLLVMKMLSNRTIDFPDLVDLVRSLNIADPHEVVRLVHEAYPDGHGARMPSDDDLLIDATEIIREAAER